MVTSNAPAKFSPRLPIRYRLFRWFLMLAGRVLLRTRIVGRKNIPAGNYIVVGNHLSWIDPFLLMIALPAEPRLYFIGARRDHRLHRCEWRSAARLAPIHHPA